MTRIRSIHPGQWTSGDFLECSPMARLLALALRNVADDHGAFRWKPTTIKAECLPADNCDVAVLLEELIRNNQLIRYVIGGKEYGLIRDFMQWQHPRRPQYLYPTPDLSWNTPDSGGNGGDHGGDQTETEADIGGNDTTLTQPKSDNVRTKPDDSRQCPEISFRGRRREEEEKKKEGRDTRARARATLAPCWTESDWDRFWAEFPNKVGKAAARLAFQKATYRVAPETMFPGLLAYATKTDDRPWCNPATWLNQDRWDDQPSIRAGPTVRPLTEFQRKQQETRDVLDQLRAYGNGRSGGGADGRNLSTDHGERSAGLRGGDGGIVFPLSRALDRGGG
jgi:hypothetical protein